MKMRQIILITAVELVLPYNGAYRAANAREVKIGSELYIVNFNHTAYGVGIWPKQRAIEMRTECM